MAQCFRMKQKKDGSMYLVETSSFIHTNMNFMYDFVGNYSYL